MIHQLLCRLGFHLYGHWHEQDENGNPVLENSRAHRSVRTCSCCGRTDMVKYTGLVRYY